MRSSKPLDVIDGNRLSSHSYAKDYDAIVTFDANGLSGQVVVEYERTYKSERVHEEVCRKQAETRVGAFLYFTQNPQLQSLLMQSPCTTRRLVYVGIMREFCTDPFQARLIDVRLGTTRAGGLGDLLEAPGRLASRGFLLPLNSGSLAFKYPPVSV